MNQSSQTSKTPQDKEGVNNEKGVMGTEAGGE